MAFGGVGKLAGQGHPSLLQTGSGILANSVHKMSRTVNHVVALNDLHRESQESRIHRNFEANACTVAQEGTWCW